MGACGCAPCEKSELQLPYEAGARFPLISRRAARTALAPRRLADLVRRRYLAPIVLATPTHPQKASGGRSSHAAGAHRGAAAARSRRAAAAGEAGRWRRRGVLARAAAQLGRKLERAAARCGCERRGVAGVVEAVKGPAQEAAEGRVQRGERARRRCGRAARKGGGGPHCWPHVRHHGVAAAATGVRRRSGP